MHNMHNYYLSVTQQFAKNVKICTYYRRTKAKKGKQIQCQAKRAQAVCPYQSRWLWKLMLLQLNSIPASRTSCCSSIGGNFPSYSLQLLSLSTFPTCGRWQKWPWLSTLPNVPTLCHTTISFTRSLATILDNRMLANITQAETWKGLSTWTCS